MEETEDETNQFFDLNEQIKDYVIPPADLIRSLTISRQLYRVGKKIKNACKVNAESQVVIDLQLMPQVVQSLYHLGYSINKTKQQSVNNNNNDKNFSYIISWLPDEEKSRGPEVSMTSLNAEEEKGEREDNKNKFPHRYHKRMRRDTEEERFCSRCHSSFDMDPQSLDGVLPDYMQGLCSTCFKIHYTPQISNVSN